MVDAEDALTAALKVKAEQSEALITYVRRQNRRGDARHPHAGAALSLVRYRRERLTVVIAAKLRPSHSFS